MNSPRPSSFDTETREQEAREAEILSQHLPPEFTGALENHVPTPSAPEREDVASPVGGPGQKSSLKLQGGDIHRDLFRIEARQKFTKLAQRSASFSVPADSAAASGSGNAVVAGVEPVPNPNEPGGFRRNFIERHHKLSIVTAPVANSFVDFLDIYGYRFAGEDLASSEEGEEEGEEEEEGGEQAAERTPLLPRRKVPRVTRPGDASNVKSFFTLMKAFMGTGILFLPKAFSNGGMLFSSIALVTIAAFTSVCFHLLLQCRRAVGGGYGDIGEHIGGSHFRTLILVSITISQLGFVCAGLIFTAENMYSFFKAVTAEGSRILATKGLIALQLVILTPLAFVRNISKLGPAALLADICILIGIGYIYAYDISALASRGLDPTVRLFNSRSFPLTIGASIFTFEGIGLILPIQASMKRPDQFDRLLYIVMALLTVLFTAVGALSYGTFGSKTKTEIISNFPQTDKFVNAVQFLYSLAILVGTPVQLFPALRIMEGKLFGSLSGKHNPRVKWRKNVSRIVTLLCCGLIAAVGAGNLDKFVALIGSFACVPLVYIYPAYLHWKAVATSSWVKAGDILMMAAGLVCMVYTTFVTISLWIEEYRP
ncbi:hypothetical protein AJ80_08844 [Polytolypa hystricis UAMH7299]|uniref:Amino acid transporter transmembrane domain-containing protein n=1 Tax=Polytolypa hystricis (strain UAMH7299) TaxID=1447883 RepID=A0A2B7X053_POLH7|nr:hypothetical protein AJ80_08844 [Polytolypa hystricis UAMH7299]